MRETSDQALLLAELKKVLKDRNIRYRDIAAQLALSETTVKRQLNGRGLSLVTLEAICRIADIGLIELAELAAQRGHARARALTHAQEAGLADNLFTAFLFLLLRHDWTPAEVQREFDLGEPELILHLRRLEKLRLLDLYPGNRVRLLTVRNPEWLPGGPLRRQIDHSMRMHFEKMDFHAPSSVWELETMKLSAGSIAKLGQMIAALSTRIRELAIEDRALPAEQTSWYSLLCAARPIDPRAFWESADDAG